MAESKAGVTALDEYMYLTAAEVDNEVSCTGSAGSALSQNSMLTTIIIGSAISFLML